MIMERYQSALPSAPHIRDIWSFRTCTNKPRRNVWSRCGVVGSDAHVWPRECLPEIVPVLSDATVHASRKSASRPADRAFPAVCRRDNPALAPVLRQQHRHLDLRRRETEGHGNDAGAHGNFFCRVHLARATRSAKLGGAGTYQHTRSTFSASGVVRKSFIIRRPRAPTSKSIGLVLKPW